MNLELNFVKKQNSKFTKQEQIINCDKIYFSTLIGKRETNEDCHNITNLHGINMYSIYDGHGGDFTSKFLSKIMPIILNKYIKNFTTENFKNHIEKIFYKLQQMLKLKYNKQATQTGSTSLICLHDINKNLITAINLGDSRLIVCKNNISLPITKDHKPSWPEEKYRIENLNGKIKYDGYDWRIKGISVSRSFGDLDIQPFVSQKPDIFRYKISTNDKFLVMACDGLWDVLSNQDVVNYVLCHCYDNTLSMRINKKLNISEKLANYAIKQGSTDNISIIIVFFE